MRNLLGYSLMLFFKYSYNSGHVSTISSMLRDHLDCIVLITLMTPTQFVSTGFGMGCSIRVN